MNWYLYNQAGKHVGSFHTKELAIEWAHNNYRQWREQGAPRVALLSVHYNGLAGTKAESIPEPEPAMPCLRCGGMGTLRESAGPRVSEYRECPDCAGRGSY